MKRQSAAIDATPSGITAIVIRITRNRVPKMAGKMPPAVIPCSGAEKRKCRESTGHPCQAMLPRMTATNAMITKQQKPVRAMKKPPIMRPPALSAQAA